MDDFASLIDKLGSLTETADALGVGAQAVSNMKARDSIAAVHWPRIVALAARKGLEGVTIEALASMAARKAPPIATTQKTAFAREPEVLAS